MEQQERLVQVLEEQLAYMKKQNEELSIKLDQSLAQNKVLSEQIRQLTKALFGSKSEKSKYQAPDGQGSLFEDDLFFSEPEHTEEQSTDSVTYTVVRKLHKKKRNDSFLDHVEIEEIHHRPDNIQCDCCRGTMAEAGTTLVREEAKFIPATMKRIRHFESAYECRSCKKDITQKAQIKRGKAPNPILLRSLAGPSVLAKVIYDKYVQYLPLYRQVKEWARSGLMTNDKNLSNWVIRGTKEWLYPVYQYLEMVMNHKSFMHFDETTAQVLHRTDGKSPQSTAYNWVRRSLPVEGPVIVLFHHALSRSRTVLDQLTTDFKGTIICDGYSAYGKLDNITFANCWAHVRRYWLKAVSKHGKKGVDFCDRLYRLERKFKHLSPRKREKARQKESKPILEEFFNWIETSPFFGKNALAKAAEYTLNRAAGLKAFLDDGRLEIDNNPAENAIRPSVIGRKNWLFSTSEAGAEANAICLSLAETAKANGIDFYKYLVKLFTELPNQNIYQNPKIIKQYMPWSKNIQATCAK
ncbi:IS66 family transposase [Solibacillus sp. FSL R5-0691]|uniref:IS66 family transposase n=1 Tax=Solibacillus sp. FSL R5-0691 TaxID=2921653 RepID=UPI0030CE7EBB